MTGTLFELLAVLAAFSLNVYVAVDARATPVEAFKAVGRSRTLWMTLSLFGAFLVYVGVLIAAYYLVRVRPQVRPEVERLGLADEVSARTKLVRIVLPGLAIATAVALGASSAGRP